MKQTIQVLDRGPNGLLDGHGKPLPSGAMPVWLTFTIDDCGKATNSAGEVFSPNITEESFEERDDQPETGKGMAQAETTVQIKASFANPKPVRALIRAMEIAEELAEGNEWNQDLVRLRKLIRIAAKGIRLDTRTEDGTRLFKE